MTSQKLASDKVAVVAACKELSSGLFEHSAFLTTREIAEKMNMLRSDIAFASKKHVDCKKMIEGDENELMKYNKFVQPLVIELNKTWFGAIEPKQRIVLNHLPAGTKPEDYVKIKPLEFKVDNPNFDFIVAGVRYEPWSILEFNQVSLHLQEAAK